MKALLIYLRSPKHYSVWNPLSIESLIGHLRHTVPEIEISGADIKEEADRIGLLNDYADYDIIGFSISSYTLDVYKELIRQMKLHNKYIILGNQLPTYLPGDLFKLTLENSDVKTSNLFISVGEGEICLQNLLKHILEKDYNYSDINNLVYQAGGEMVTNAIEPVDLSQLKFPPEYFFEGEGSREVMQMQLSRGCYWGNCSFCTRLSFRNGIRWQSFPMDRIKQDLFNAIKKMNVQAIEFCDDEFFGGRTQDKLERALEIGEYIDKLSKQRGNRVQFRIFTRPDFIYRPKDGSTNLEVKNVLSKLKEFGLTRVYMGIESGCDSQLKRYNRGIDVGIVESAIRILKEINLNFDSGFILFDPGLCLEEICNNIIFYKKNDLIETNQWFWRPMIANVGSAIGDKLLKEGNDYDINSMSVQYNFKDPLVEYISKIIDIKSKKTKDIFYALKSISKKDYDYSDVDKYNYLAHSFVKQNGMIYVELLEHIAKALVDADEKVELLVNELEKLCMDGQFQADDAKKINEKIEEYRNNRGE